MKKMISVSTEPAKDFVDLISYDKQMFGIADFIHCDVMKKPFVNRNLFDFSILNQFASNAKLPLDIHLMTENLNDEYIKYLNLKPKFLTVHYEAFENKEQLINLLKLIRKNNVLAGLSIKPETEIEQIEDLFPFFDLLLIMSVEIGKSGQKLLEKTYDKIKKAHEIITKNELSVLIEVDGGVNEENANKLYLSGANILVSGHFVYNSKDKINAVKILTK